MQPNFKFVSNLCLSVLGGTLILVSAAKGEVVCSSELSYQWTPLREGEPSSVPSQTPSPGQSPVPTVAESTIPVRWIRVASSAADEVKARAEAQRYIDREREAAMRSCKESHENISRCIAAKFNGAAQAMSQLGFAARKALESTIQHDCEVNQGRCVGVTATDLTCAIADAPAATTSASVTPTPEATSADKKGKKK